MATPIELDNVPRVVANVLYDQSINIYIYIYIYIYIFIHNTSLGGNQTAETLDLALNKSGCPIALIADPIIAQ